MTHATTPDGLLARIGAAIRRRRTAAGTTIKDLAAAAGLSARFVSDLEAGRANIAIGRLAAVADALGADLAALVTDESAAGPAAELQRLTEGRSPADLERCVTAVRLALGAGGRSRARRLIALWGLRGAGKSSLGKALAEALGLPFVELDDRVEQVAGLSQAELFALHGEGYYRRLVGQCVVEVVGASTPSVAAFPGGIVHDEVAFPLLQRHATTVWLRADPTDHMSRVLAQGDRRPMAQSEDAMAELRALLASREPLYRQADITVDTSLHGDESLAALLAAVAAQGWAPRGR